jgi:hypothetical protein
MKLMRKLLKAEAVIDSKQTYYRISSKGGLLERGFVSFFAHDCFVSTEIL